VGAPVEAVVARFNAEDGLYELNRVGASVDVSDWEEIAEGIVIDVVVTGHNKGGLECQVGKLRGFIPASQVSVYRVENLEELVGERLACVVTESNAERRNLVLSRRAAMERERAESKARLMEELAPGQQREGVVTSLRDFGAFVDLGGVDGLVHVSRLSWDRVSHPSEVLEVGQRVKVKVEKIDEETGKIGLSLRDMSENPWDRAERRYPVKSTVRGEVAKIMDFGALVRLEPGISGLVHISELSHKRVFRVGDVVKEGEQVEAQVVSVDAESQRIGLSMKALETRPVEKKADAADDAAEGVAAESARPKLDPAKLKGGVGRNAGGEKFGLKW
jgi:small subunit ribosomal protein S1